MEDINEKKCIYFEILVHVFLGQMQSHKFL